MPDEVCLSITMNIGCVDLEMPASFLSPKAGVGYSPTSGQIEGMSKTEDAGLDGDLKTTERHCKRKGPAGPPSDTLPLPTRAGWVKRQRT